jgi:hypothetical protein
MVGTSLENTTSGGGDGTMKNYQKRAIVRAGRNG